MISGEATNIKFYSLWFDTAGAPTIYHTRDGHVNRYATDAAKLNLNAFYCINNEHIKQIVQYITYINLLMITCNS